MLSTAYTHHFAFSSVGQQDSTATYVRVCMCVERVCRTLAVNPNTSHTSCAKQRSPFTCAVNTMYSNFASHAPSPDPSGVAFSNTTTC